MKDNSALSEELETLRAQLAESAAVIARDKILYTRLMSCLNHDFRTPLNAILSLSQIMLDRLDGELSPEQEKQVTFMRKGALDLTAMINELLELARAGGRASQVPAENIPSKKLSAISAANGKRKILMIDDSEADRYVFRRSMAARGDIAVLEADCGRRGLELARLEKPDVIVIDMNLPDMNGYEVLRGLSEDAAVKTIPVIVHSSMVLRDDERQTLLARAHSIMSKDPAQADAFGAAIYKLLEQTPDQTAGRR